MPPTLYLSQTVKGRRCQNYFMMASLLCSDNGAMNHFMKNFPKDGDESFAVYYVETGSRGSEEDLGLGLGLENSGIIGWPNSFGTFYSS